jgi:hypothetical protein
MILSAPRQLNLYLTGSFVELSALVLFTNLHCSLPRNATSFSLLGQSLAFEVKLDLN